MRCILRTLCGCMKEVYHPYVPEIHVPISVRTLPLYEPAYKEPPPSIEARIFKLKAKQTDPFSGETVLYYLEAPK